MIPVDGCFHTAGGYDNYSQRIVKFVDECCNAHIETRSGKRTKAMHRYLILAFDSTMATAPTNAFEWGPLVIPPLQSHDRNSSAHLPVRAIHRAFSPSTAAILADAASLHEGCVRRALVRRHREAPGIHPRSTCPSITQAGNFSSLN